MNQPSIKRPSRQAGAKFACKLRIYKNGWQQLRWYVMAGTFVFVTMVSVRCNSTNVVAEQPNSGLSNLLPLQPSATPESDTDPGMAILNKIVSYKKANPNVTVQALADYGNEQLPSVGFDYDFDLEKTINAKIRGKATKPIKKPNDDFSYVSFPFQFRTESGGRAILNITAPEDASCCCGYFYTPIPVTQVSAQRLTIVIDGKPVPVRRPKEFPVVQEYILYEDRDHPRKIRSWEVPYETYPIGVSNDGLTLYIDTEVEDLLLGISSADGRTKFMPKAAENIIKDSEVLRKQPQPKVGEILHKSGNFGLYRFIIQGKPYLLEFPYPCT